MGATMAEYTAQELSEERLRQAAEEFVRRGIDIRGKVHDLTLAALQSRRFDRDAMRDVFRAITAGVATGRTPRSRRQTVVTSARPRGSWDARLSTSRPLG